MEGTLDFDIFWSQSRLAEILTLSIGLLAALHSHRPLLHFDISCKAFLHRIVPVRTHHYQLLHHIVVVVVVEGFAHSEEIDPIPEDQHF